MEVSEKGRDRILATQKKVRRKSSFKSQLVRAWHPSESHMLVTIKGKLKKLQGSNHEELGEL